MQSGTEVGKNIDGTCLHMICSILVARVDMKDMLPPRTKNIITKALLVKTNLRVPR